MQRARIGRRVVEVLSVAEWEEEEEAVEELESAEEARR